MKMLLAISCLVFVFGAVTKSVAVEADQYEFRAALAFDRAIDIAAAGDRIFVLSPGTLSVLDGALAGPALNRVGSISIEREFAILAADGNVVALATRDGEVSIYHLDGAGLAHRADYDSPDSIISMTLVGDALCLAQGYDGVRIVDVSDPSRPRVMQNLLEPDYSREVDLAGEFLFVLDVLNGVTVFARSNGEYLHLDDIWTDTAPKAISTHKSGVAIAYGTQRCEVWNCGMANGATLEWIVETEFSVSLIAGSRAVDTMFFLGSETGELSVVGRVSAQSSMPYPVDKILAFEKSALYSVVVLDRGGNVTAFKSNPILATKVSYDAATKPGAIVAVDGGLVVSTSTGIQSLSFSSGGVDSRMILPGAPVTNILAESDGYLFAGSELEGRVRTYVRERGRWKAQGEFQTDLTLRKLFVRSGSSGEIDLIAVGDEGIKCYLLEPNGSAIATCSLSADERISYADINDDWLVTATENGEVNLYAFVRGDVMPVGETRCAARPRDVIVTPEGVVVVAHSGGIDVFDFDSSSGELVALESPAAISSAFDLNYDVERQELIVTSGPTPVKYLDFSDPTQLGTVFLIAGTEGTSGIAIRDETLYCLSADWVRAFQRRENPAEQQRANADLQSVTATPNPFNSDTQIAIELTPNARLPLPFEVSFVNLLGQTLSRQEFVAVEQSIVIDLPQVIGSGTVLPSGVYFLVVRTSGEAITRKLLLLK